SQTALDHPGDVGRRAARSLAVDFRAELCRDHDLVALVAERLAEQHLALRAAVDVGGIEQRDSGLDRSADDLRGGGGVEPPAEVVATKAHDGDLERAEAA